MEQKISTRGLTESAIMAALITIIVILSSYFSFFYGISMMILPILVAIVGYRHNIKCAIGCVAVSTLIVAMMFNPITAITMGVNYGIIGVTLGYALSRKYSSYKVLIITIIASIIAIGIDFALTGLLISGQNVFQFMESQARELSEMFAVSIDQTLKVYEAMGITGEQLEMMGQVKEMITPEFIIMIIPAIICLTAFLQSYVCLILFSLIFRKLKYGNIEVVKFSDFYVTNLVGAVLIGAMCIGIIAYGRGLTWGMTLYNSIYMITIVILSINGMAASQYFLSKKMKLPKISRILIIIAIFMMSSFIVFGIIGFIEMLLDFRRLDPHRLRKA